jgi:hypothetical protein
MYDFKLSNGTFTVVTPAEFDAGEWRVARPSHVLIVRPEVDLTLVRSDHLERLMKASKFQRARWAAAGNKEPSYTAFTI